MNEWKDFANDLHLILMSNPRGDFVVSWKAERTASKWAAGLSRLHLPLWFIGVLSVLASHYINTVIDKKRFNPFYHNHERACRWLWTATAYAEVAV